MTKGTIQELSSNTGKPDYATSMAFAAVVFIGGSISVAVRISNFELPPFWNAGIRSFSAALIFFFIIIARRIALPRKKALVGAILYGLLTVGFSYALFYWGLLRLQAGLASVVLALIPLFTMFFALLHGMEDFRLRGLMGALIAIAGILIVVGKSLDTSVSLMSFLALIAGAACMAEGSILFKLSPKPHPHATNAVALATGAVFLFLLSYLSGEKWNLPTTVTTWAAFLYLVTIATVGLYYLYLHVLGRWTASATNHSFMLFPISTAVLASWFLGEAMTLPLVLGSAMVLLGVWVGAFSDAARGGIGKEGSTKNE